VNEIIVPVTITDDKGRFISNLEKKDFEILDEGKPQTINFFSRERSQPVVAGFLIDLSNSSRAQWKNFQTAATELVLTLLPGKEKFSGYMIGYGNKAELQCSHGWHGVSRWRSVPSLQEFLLRSIPWIPVRRDPGGQKARGRDARMGGSSAHRPQDPSVTQT
jgi:hypothetical protein